LSSKFVREQVAIAHAGGGNRAQPRKKGVGLGVVADDGGHRSVAELIVVAIVSNGGGALGAVLQTELVILLEERVLGGDAVGYGGCWRSLRKGERRQGGDEERAAEDVHMTKSVADVGGFGLVAA